MSDRITSNRGELAPRPMNYERESYDERPMVENDPSELAKEIIITPVNYGFMVRVGCQTLAIENLSTLLNNLNSYLLNPRKYQEIWDKTKKLI